MKDDYNLKSFNGNFINNIIESEITSDKIYYHEVSDVYFGRV